MSQSPLKQGIILFVSGSLTALVIVGIFWTIFRSELDAARSLVRKANTTFELTEQVSREIDETLKKGWANFQDMSGEFGRDIRHDFRTLAAEMATQINKSSDGFRENYKTAMRELEIIKEQFEVTARHLQTLDATQLDQEIRSLAEQAHQDRLTAAAQLEDATAKVEDATEKFKDAAAKLADATAKLDDAAIRFRSVGGELERTAQHLRAVDIERNEVGEGPAKPSP